MKKYRIVNRFRFITFLVVCLLLLSLLVLPLFNTCFARIKAEKAYVQIVVNYGDTLWQIAKDYGPNDRDIRRVIYEICKLNSVSAESLKAGDVLLVPSRWD